MRDPSSTAFTHHDHCGAVLGRVPLREEWERSGAWLFKQRSHFPLLLIALMLVELWLAPPARLAPWAEAAWSGFCLLLAFLGLLIRAHAVGHVPAGTSARQTRAPGGGSINQTGFYSVVRHPLYLGNFLLWAGIAAWVRSWRFELIVILVFWIYYERIMYAEEEYLRRSFGEAYERWAERTPAFLPDFSRWTRPELPLSWRVVIRREHSSFFAAVATFTVAVYARDLFLDGRISPHPGWTAFFLAGLVLFLAAVFLTRRTALLHVEGR